MSTLSDERTIELIEHYSDRLVEGERQELIDAIRNSVQRATTMLDDDERSSFSGSRVQRDRQTLHAFWGSNAFYLGWRGGYWEVDGALFAYLSTGGAGTTALISPTNTSNVLPFAADVAVVITGKTQGQWYRYSAGSWQPQAGLSFKQGVSGDTEIRVPLAVQSLSAVRLLAFARSDEGDA